MDSCKCIHRVYQAAWEKASSTAIGKAFTRTDFGTQTSRLTGSAEDKVQVPAFLSELVGAKGKRQD